MASSHCHSVVPPHPSFVLSHDPNSSFFFFFNDTATTEIYTLSLHDALPISPSRGSGRPGVQWSWSLSRRSRSRSEEHTSELQSRPHLVCRLLLEKKKKISRHAPKDDVANL